MALFNCPECGKEISDEAKSCPNCGYSLKNKSHSKKTKHKWLIILVLLIALGVIGYYGWNHISSNVNTTKPKTINSSKNVELTKDNFEDYFSISYSYSELNTSTDYFGITKATAVLNVDVSPKANIISTNNVTVNVSPGTHWEPSSGNFCEPMSIAPNGQGNKSISVQTSGIYYSGYESYLASNAFIVKAEGNIEIAL